MKLLPFDYFCWLLKFVLECICLYFVVRLHRYQRALGLYLSYSIVRSLTLLSCHFLGNYSIYFTVYWVTEPVSVTLLGILMYSLFMQVFAPLATLPRSTVPIMLNAIMGILFTVTFLSVYRPAEAFAANGQGLEWLYLIRTLERAGHFVISLSLLAIVSMANFFAMPWKSQAYGIAAGYSVAVSVNLVRSIIIASVGFPSSTWRVSSLAYLVCLFVWVSYLRKPARSVLVPSAQMVKFMFDLLPPSTAKRPPENVNDTRRAPHAAVNQ